MLNKVKYIECSTNQRKHFFYIEAPTTPTISPCKVKIEKAKVKHKQCVSKEEVALASCSGACESSATFTPEAPYFMQECSCCKPVEFEDVEIPMYCLRKRSSSIKVKRITKCECKRCSEGDKADPISSLHDDEENPDEIMNDPSVSKGKKKRSITDMVYDFFSGN